MSFEVWAAHRYPPLDMDQQYAAEEAWKASRLEAVAEVQQQMIPLRNTTFEAWAERANEFQYRAPMDATELQWAREAWNAATQVALADITLADGRVYHPKLGTDIRTDEAIR